MSEILGVLFGLMLGLMGMSHISSNLREQQHLQNNIATAMQQQDWVQGVTDYTTTNMLTLQSTATATSPVVINLATLQAAGVTLPSGFNGTNPYNQTWVAEVLQPTAGHLQVLAYSTGGTTISDKDLGSIARNSAGVGGMIPSNDSGAYPGGAGTAYGAFGAWQIATTNYTSVAGGHPASLLNFSNGSLTSNYLYRNAVPGQPQLNQMNTDLGMNGHNITSVGQLQTGNGNGVQVGSTYLYGDSTNSAIRQNGSFNVQNQAGTGYATLNAGNINAAGNVAATGSITAGGNAGVGGNLSVTGNGQVNGTLTTGGKVTSGGILQVNGSATAGTACSSNGQMAQGPSGPLFCQSGVWGIARPTATVVAVATTPSCGNASTSQYAGQISTAMCPANSYMTGGGYSLTKYAPILPTNVGNSPDISAPASSNQWYVYAGGFPGGTCFVAFAVCQQ